MASNPIGTFAAGIRPFQISLTLDGLFIFHLAEAWKTELLLFRVQLFQREITDKCNFCANICTRQTESYWKTYCLTYNTDRLRCSFLGTFMGLVIKLV